MNQDRILEIVIEVVILIIASYFIFYKKFLEELGKQTAELVTIRQKTQEIEQIKNSFNRELELFKKSLEIDFFKKIEPLKTALEIIAFKQNEIFSLEKESIIQFNNDINYFLWGTMGFDVYELSMLNPEQIAEKRKLINSAYNKTAISFGSLSLIIENANLIDVGNASLLETLKLKNFIETKLATLHINKTWEKHSTESFLEYLKNPKASSEIMESHFVSMERNIKSEIKEATDSYTSEYMNFFKPSKFKIEEFKLLAKQYLKNPQSNP